MITGHGHRTTVAILALLAPGSAIVAQCEPENLVGNCGFEVDTDGWFVFFADSLVRTTAEAHGGVASCEVDALQPIPPAALASIHTCFGLTGGVRYEATGYFKVASGAGVQCSVDLRYFDDHECFSAKGYSEQVWVPIGELEWEHLGGVLTAPAWANSASVIPYCYSEQDFVYRVDDIVVLLLDAPMFRDGFESGDTSAWDFVVP